jgi:hypothetical protein
MLLGPALFPMELRSHIFDVMKDEATYVCIACGEEIVVPIDLSAGESQQYVEDCPVCCRPNLIHVELDADGEPSVWADAEQDED